MSKLMSDVASDAETANPASEIASVADAHVNSGFGTVPKQHKDVYPAISPDVLASSMTGKTVLVTGAGRGIGRSIALSFALAGAKGLAILSRTESELRSLASEIASAYPKTKTLVCVADVSDRSALAKVMKDINRELGGIDVLIANAGVLSFRPFVYTPGEEWWRVLEINLKGPMMLAEMVLPGMRILNNGAIVFMVSQGGIFTQVHTRIINHPAGFSSYSVSKAALIRSCATLQLELDVEAGGHGKSGIHMYALHPGCVKSDIMLPALHPDIEKMQKGYSERTRIFFENGFYQTPELCAQTCVYLATGRASALRGRYIDAGNDIEDLVRQADLIRRENMYDLGLKILGGEFAQGKEWYESFEHSSQR